MFLTLAEHQPIFSSSSVGGVYRLCLHKCLDDKHTQEDATAQGGGDERWDSGPLPHGDPCTNMCYRFYSLMHGVLSAPKTAD